MGLELSPRIPKRTRAKCLPSGHQTPPRTWSLSRPAVPNKIFFCCRPALNHGQRLRQLTNGTTSMISEELACGFVSECGRRGLSRLSRYRVIKALNCDLPQRGAGKSCLQVCTPGQARKHCLHLTNGPAWLNCSRSMMLLPKALRLETYPSV